MAKTYEEITPELVAWLGDQRVFFVATAPAALDGYVNCSPKGPRALPSISGKRIGTALTVFRPLIPRNCIAAPFAAL